MKKISSKTIDDELSLFGGFYSGEKYNFIVYGKSYSSSDKETYRIVKYDKSFNRISSLSIDGDKTYTKKPFESGTSSFAEKNNTLIFYTARLRMGDSDGYNHQSNITLRINENDMTIADEYNGAASFPTNHVSHSFRSIVKTDNDGSEIYANLSDGYPCCGVSVIKLNKDGYLYTLGDMPGINNIFYTEIENPEYDPYGIINETDAEVNGLVITENAYIVTGVFYDNAFVGAVDKSTGKITKTLLTKYNEYSEYGLAQESKIVQISKNESIVLWQTIVSGIYSINYVKVDKDGKIIGKTKTAFNAVLSECQPIYDENKIIWYTIIGGKNTLYSISDLEFDGTFEPLGSKMVDAVNVWDGTYDISWYKNNINTFKITTAEQLAGLAELVNRGNDMEGKTFLLDNDIYLNNDEGNQVFIPIACISSGEKFSGVFDGGKHTIYRLYRKEKDDYTEGGLFGTVDTYGVVKNLIIDQSYIRQDSGAIAAINYGTIMYCDNMSKVTGTTRSSNRTNYVGGIAGQNYGMIYGCANKGRVIGYYGCAGGIAGYIESVKGCVKACYNSGTVSCGGTASGGIVGEVSSVGTVEDCFNIGNVLDYAEATFRNYANYIGGIAGSVYEGYLVNCYSTHIPTKNFYSKENDPLCGYCSSGWGRQLIYDCYSLYDTKYGAKVILEEMVSDEFLKKLNSVTDFYETRLNDMWVRGEFLPVTIAQKADELNFYKFYPTACITDLGSHIGLDYFGYGKTLFSSNNDKVASVDDEGNIIYNGGLGTAMITITILETDVSEKEVQTVNVTEYGMDFKNKYEILHEGETIQLNLDKYYENVPDGNISYSSSDEFVAKVSSKGKVNTYSKGVALITARQGEYIAECKIYVIDNSQVLPSGECGPELKYSLSEDGVLTFTGKGEKELSPWHNYWKNYCPLIKEIRFSKDMSSIDDDAFCGCTNIKSVTLPANIRKIGNSAFEDCTSLQNVILPESLETIGRGAFRGCTSLQNIILPESLKTIGWKAFTRTKIEKINIPKSVQEIDDYAFDECQCLKEIICKSDCGLYNAFSDDRTMRSVEVIYGIAGSAANRLANSYDIDFIPLSNKNFTVSYYSSELILKKYIGSSGIVNIPSTIDGINVSGINSDCFKGNLSITSVSVPDNISADISFKKCENLKSIKLSESMKKITKSMFSGCSSLENIDIPEGVESIGDCAFYDCESLRNITIPNSVTEIGKYAFSGCKKIKCLIIPSKLEKFSEYGLMNENLITVYGNSDVIQSVCNDFEFLSNISYFTIPTQKTTFTDKNVNVTGYLPSDTTMELLQEDGVYTIKFINNGKEIEPCGDITISVSNVQKNKHIVEMYFDNKEQYANTSYESGKYIFNTQAKSFRFVDAIKGDTNGDGKATIADSLMIARYEVKLRTLTDMPHNFISEHFASGEVDDTATELSESYYIKDTTNGCLKRLFTVAGNDTASQIITGLPYGTSYKIEETAASRVKTSDVTYKVNNVPETVTVDETTVNQTYADGDISAANVVAVTNTYPNLGSLELIKGLETGTTETSTYAEFTFHVKLSNDGVNLKDFFTSRTFTIGTTSVTIPEDKYGENSLEFDVPITSNTALTDRKITGIPYGTDYEVEEITTGKKSDNVTPYMPEGWKCVTAKQTGTVTDATATAVNKQVTITNAKVKDLELKKKVEGYAAIAPDSFQFEVTLTPPSSMTLDYFAEHYLGITNENVTAHNYAPYSLYPVENSTSFRKTVDVSKDGTVVKIEDLPYNTQYTVTETTALSTNATKADEVTTATAIGDASAVVEITNTYPGKLTLNKEITGVPPFNVTSATHFAFNVTLTKAGSTTFTVKVGDEDKSVTSGTAFTVSVSKDEPVTISNIPIGTTYLVTEQADDLTPPSANISGNMTSAVELTAAAPTGTVTITNDYPYVNKTVTLYKQDSSNHNGISGAQFYLIKLRDTTDINDETTQAAFANGTIADITTATTAYPEIYADIVTDIPGNADNVLTTGNTDDAIGVITVTEVIHDPAEATDIRFNPGERYFFFEAAEGTTILDANAPKNYKKDNTLTEAKVITINDYQNEYIVTYENEPYDPTEVDVLKTDENDEPLPGAFFDLFYKDIQITTAYSVNNPNTAPTPTRTTEVTGNQTAPNPETYQADETPATYKYQYGDQSVPSASDQDWIQPRTDNDYIYFRDYNDGTPGTADQQSFNNSKSTNQGAEAQNAKRSWLWTGFDDNVHGQHQELDYTHNYWYAAQFSGGGKAMVQYAVWERFVDRVTMNGAEQDTVVWKIQPPDGYTKVRFLLYDGSQCIRTTKEFTFQLGAIYHKTNWGGSWSSQNGKDCYWEVPVIQEKVWTTYRDSDNYSQTLQNDKRQSSTLIEQADRYTPTDQKIVFHCNSKAVWHNIHIEFFADAEGHQPVGQKTPGYMMEPYAYAGSDYRINGYLTYELTIPAEAKYFRVNNGVSSGSPYYFRSEITALKHIEGRKNYGNYFKIADDYRNMTTQPIRMTEWTSYTSTGDKWAETYKTLDVDSDYDYVYFEAPASWGSHIYAYFYGGGNLREDNWQRACYSIWPGVAAVSSEYDVDGTTEYHSDIYHYTYTGSSLYTGTADSLSNPESSFIGQNGKVVYKFRIPKGDRKNYSKVIFNNGLKTQVSSSNGADGKTHETAVITYKAGYIYYPSGSSTKHYENNTTVSYTKRGTGDDYIYVKVPDSDTVWDDLHVTFYDANNNQILQGGKGYIMEYSGVQTDSGTDYKYFRIPIPTGASKFAVNNGMEKQDGHTRQTAHYDILRLDTVGNDYSTDYTKNRMVFTLDTANSTLAQTSPTFTQVVDTPAQPGAVTGQDAHIDYTVRGTTAEPARTDTLNIRDTGDWGIAVPDGKIKFYDANGTLITGDGSKGNGNYTLIKTVNDTGSPAKPWYTIGIPENAVSFSISYHANGGTGALVTTPTYDIYPFGDSSTEGNHTTTGNMYYETQSGSNALTLMTGTYTTSAAFSYDYTSRKTNGDFLYLVASDKDKWSDMKVVFYNGEGNAIEVNATEPKTEVTPYYLNNVAYDPIAPVDGISTSDPDAAGEWYKAAIPYGATSFTVTGTDTTNSNAAMTASGTIYRLTDTPTRYDNGWTLGDMQYRLPDSSGIKPTLLYPVFTEEESQSMEVGNQTISDYNGTLADEQAVEEYAKSEAAPQPTDNVSLSSGTYPVLYATADSKVTYEWEVAANKIYFDNSSTGWSRVYARFSDAESTQYEMTQLGDTDIYYLDMSTSALSGYMSGTYNVRFNNDSASVFTVYKSLTIGYCYTPDLKSGNKAKILYLKKTDGNNDNVFAKFDSETSYYRGEDANNDLSQSGSRKWYMYNKPSNVSNDNTAYAGDTLRNKVVFSYVDSGSNSSAQITLKNHGYGEVWTVSSRGGTVTFLGYMTGDGAITSGDDKDKIPMKDPELYTGSGAGGGTTSVTYQPEDRYTYISDIGATTDANNFITIQTSITDPYIHFYTTNDGTGTEIGGTTTGIKLAYTKVNGTELETTPSSPYTIRLPRGARSFKITGKNSGTPVTSAMQKLYDTVDVKTADGQPYNAGTDGDAAHVSVTNFHHAGTTFSYGGTNGTALAIESLRSGYTVGKTAMADPLNPKSDADHIFFTDTNNTFGGNGATKKVYAYFYGDTDGEYSAWPGELATTTANYTAITTYTDNNGATVYKFRIPQDSAGKYKKVIFNNGVSSIKITEAMDIQPGANYTLGAVKTGAAYDKLTNSASTFAPAGSVYTATVSQKTTQIPTKSYDISGNKYIYIINNGTQNLTGSTVEPNRFIFDELHVTFYDEDKKSIGTKEAGYLPDLLKGYDSNEDPNNPNWVYVNAEGNDVYRIQVPANAKYFQINNGINKGLTDDVDTKLRERYSVIEPITVNGLYKFVDGTHTAAEYLEAGAEVPADETERHNPNYLLTLVNERHTDDEPPPTRIESVKLATIETNDDEGSNIRWITYLKPAEGHESDNPQTTVDKNYLDHTVADIKNTSVTKVKVVKKGTYYWVESSAPSGYKMNEDRHLIEVKDDGVYIYNESGELVKSTGGIVTITNEKEDEPEGEVILTKTAKEKVGTTDIGDVLVGAKFKLVDANETDKVLKFTRTQIDPDTEDSDSRTTNVYTLNNAGTFNVEETSEWIETGADGKLHIKGLPLGDYYLEEQEAPAGYSHLDSNDLDSDDKPQNKKIYFSVGANREVKEISASDEMEPAYIRLFEHISEKRDEWGDPTFVFKIRQTGYETYNADGTPNELVYIDDGKEILVALTVNDDGKIVDTVKWFGADGSTPTVFRDNAEPDDPTFDDPINTDFNDWLVEGTTELDDYEGMFRIDSKGRIRVEPGAYEITRLPVSRYEFVTNGMTYSYMNDTEPDPWMEYSEAFDPYADSDKLELTIMGGNTVDVHYYDKVAYYDKFTQVDEKINKFYTRDSDKQNTTMKGIRIDDYKQKGNVPNGDTNDSDVMTINVADLKIYKIMSDGSEVEMTPDEKAAIASADISVTYTYAEKDDKHFGGDSEAETPIPAQFSYDDTNKRITVTGAETFVKGVYTLKANYKGFTDEFDIVFLRETATP